LFLSNNRNYELFEILDLKKQFNDLKGIVKAEDKQYIHKLNILAKDGSTLRSNFKSNVQYVGMVRFNKYTSVRYVGRLLYKVCWYVVRMFLTPK